MWRMMNLVGRPDTQLYEIAGHGHGAMGNPAYHILIQSINKILGKKYEFQLDSKILKMQELRVHGRSPILSFHPRCCPTLAAAAIALSQI